MSGRRHGYPFSCNHSFHGQDASSAKKATGTWCCAEANRSLFSLTVQEGPATSGVTILLALRKGVAEHLLFASMAWSPVFPTCICCGAGTPPLGKKLWVTCMLVVGRRGLHAVSCFPGYLSSHSSTFSFLRQEGLGPHCPSQAEKWPGNFLSNKVFGNSFPIS